MGEQNMVSSHAIFHNPRTTPSKRKVKLRENEKIMQLIETTMFAWLPLYNASGH
jgi:hypothetical protein